MEEGKQLVYEITDSLLGSNRAQAAKMYKHQKQGKKVDVSMNTSDYGIMDTASLNAMAARSADVFVSLQAKDAINTPMDSLLVSPRDIPSVILGGRRIDLAI